MNVNEQTLQNLFDIIMAEGMTNRLLNYIALSGKTNTEVLTEIVQELDETEPNEWELRNFFERRMV